MLPPRKELIGIGFSQAKKKRKKKKKLIEWNSIPDAPETAAIYLVWSHVTFAVRLGPDGRGSLSESLWQDR